MQPEKWTGNGALELLHNRQEMRENSHFSGFVDESKNVSGFKAGDIFLYWFLEKDIEDLKRKRDPIFFWKRSW